MFVRRTLTRRTGGQDYHSHRLVHSRRDGAKVRQRTLLNLGSDFDLPKAKWPELCQRIDEILNGQAPLVDDTPTAVEEEAQRIAAQLLARGRAGDDAEAVRGPVRVDVASLELTRPRSVGVEQVGLWAVERLGLTELLSTLGINASLRTAAVASIVARLAYPASEPATHAWLRERSALGELLGVDFETMGTMQLYRASDALVAHREAIEAHLFDRAMDLFDLTPTVTLYDLTNTYYEGDVADQPEARRGRSKEKRSACKLLTVGLVLDGGGFVRSSRVFAGNVKEDRTLSRMLDALGAPPGSRVVLDRGIATGQQVDWLKANGYRYVVVSRERKRNFEPEAALAHRTRSGGVAHLEKVDDAEAGEVRLYCYSEQRAEKERGMAERFAQRLERDLDAINEGLSRPRTQKKPEKIRQRIGRLVEKSRGVGRHYDIAVATDESGKRAVAVTYRRQPVTGTMLTHPGVYCLRSNETDFSEERLWRTFALLTDVEAVFRSLKSELGLRPVHHRKPRRAEGHLFITVIAYQLVQVIRTRLAECGDGPVRTADWTTLKRILGGRQRVTATFKRADGRTLHVRQATRPEPQQKAILDALGIASSAGGTRQAVV